MSTNHVLLAVALFSFLAAAQAVAPCSLPNHTVNFETGAPCVAGKNHSAGPVLTPGPRARIMTNGTDLTFIPPTGGTIKFVESNGEHTTVTSLLANDKMLSGAVAKNAEAQDAFAASTATKLQSLTEAIDKTVKTQIAGLQSKLDLTVKNTDTKLNLAAEAAKKTQAATMVKIDQNKKDISVRATKTQLNDLSQLMVKTVKEATVLTEAEYTKAIKASIYCAAKHVPQGYTPAKVAEADFKAGRLFVGLYLTGASSLCSKGTYNTIPHMYCTTSLRFCGNPNYCASSPKPACAACPKNCEVCSNANTCSKCSGQLVSKNGVCVNPSSCWPLLRDGKIKDGVTKIKFTSPKGGRTNVDGRCIVENKRAHTMIPCQNLGDCRGFHRFNEANGCERYGYQITPMRSRAHFNLAAQHYGYGFMNSMAPGAHVYKTGGGGRYTNCIMRKHSSGHCAQWRAKDGKDWWLRDSGYGEPSGDYSAWCNLGGHGVNSNGYHFNDGGCYHSGSRYWCGTEDYDGKGSPNGN